MFSKEEARVLRQEFWIKFSDYTNFFSLKKGVPVKWMLYKTGIKGLELKFDINKKDIKVILEINCKNSDRRFDIFVELDNYKKILEYGFAENLIWEEDYNINGHKAVSRIYVEMQDVKYYNKNNWVMIFEFMAENMFTLQSNLEEILPVLKEKFGK